jgi:UDP-N-acetylmuramoyl-L-alanyl-D-glutamate--2,6-diaminopimelate ligase
MESYSTVKKLLFEEGRCRLAVLNADDPIGLEIGAERKGETLYYGLETPAHSFAVPISEGIYGTELMLNLSDSLERVRLQLTGKHNIYNALAAATVAFALGVPTAKIAEGLSLLTRVKGRLELVCEYKGGKVFVDFAHTPDGLRNSLSSLKRFCRGRLICVFGCGGNRDKLKRPEMGRIAASLADFCVLTSDNPRYEDTMDIIADIEKGYRRVSARYVIVPEREKAIGYALELLKEGDILLVAGKGGEDYQEVMGIKYLSNDNDLIKEKVKERGKCP